MRSVALSSAALALAWLLASSAASAQTVAGTGQANPQRQDENGEMLQRRASSLTGAIAYNSDANADVSGGEATGAAYLQRIGLIGDADLGRLVGWRGATAHLSVHVISGTGLSASRVGNVLTVSGLEAEPALRLFNLWVQQAVGEHATVRVGQFTAGQEFAISSTANLFVNATFGWPASFAADLPSGGPAYPLGAPGVRLAVTPNDRLGLKLAVFSGDPAGRGDGDPQRRDRHGLNGWRLQGAPFVIAEVTRSAGGADPAWSVALGGWAHFGRFDDLRPGGASGRPARHDGDQAVYAIADGRLWRSGQRSIHGFVRASASPADRNPIDLYLDGGVSMTGLVRSRPDDVAGIGFAVAGLSPRLRDQVRERAATAGQPAAVPGFEGVVEASYQFKVKDGFYLQPNVQWVLHPAAGLLAGDSVAVPHAAIVLGLRTSFRH